MMIGNLKHLCMKLCQLLEIPYSIFNTNEITDLFDFSEMLFRNDFRSMVINMPLSKSTPIPTPAITQYKNGEFAIIINQQDTFLEIYDPSTKMTRQFTYEAYDSRFLRMTLLLETLENKDIYKYNQRDNRKASIDDLIGFSKLGFIFIAILLVLLFYNNLPVLGIAFLDFTCLIISSAMFLESHNIHNSIYNNLCSFKKEKGGSSCIQNGVLSDWLPISFSILSLLYFFITSMLILVYSNSTSIMYEWLLYMGIPFILFSIYKQVFTYKKMCVLCLAIIVLFLTKFILYITFLEPSFSFDILPNIMEYVVVILSISFIYGMDKYMSTKNKLIKTQNRNNNIWSKKKIIDKHLEKSEIDLPITQNKNSITLISHLYCKHCLTSLKELVRLSLLNPEMKLNVLIKYSQSSENELMMKLFIECFLEGNLLESISIYEDWKNGNYSNYRKTEFDTKVEAYFKTNKHFFDNQTIEEFPITLKNVFLIPNYIEAQNIKVAYSR